MVVQTAVSLQTVLNSLTPLSVESGDKIEATARSGREYKRSKGEVLFIQTILGIQAMNTAPIQYMGL